MVYGDTGESVTDHVFSLVDKKLMLSNYSEIFDFDLEDRELYVFTSATNYKDKLEHYFIEGKTIFVNSNLIEGSSLYYGDMLCDHFDEENNMVNPPSDTGWYLYNLFGYVFDNIQSLLSDMVLNIDPITCELLYLDIIAEEFGLKRKDGWSDEYWRALIIYYYYNLETVKGIEFVLSRIYNHRNKSENQKEPTVVLVDGYYSSFFLSDKFDKFNQCCDKFDTIDDKLSSLKEYVFNIKPPFVLEDSVIKELIKLLKNGVKQR